MKIAHITATFPPYWGGTGNVCFNNARELVRLGHEIHVFTVFMQNTPIEEIIEGVHVHRLKSLFHVGNAYILTGLLFLQDFDIIHLHYPFFGGEFAALAAKWWNIPLVITYHQDVILKGFLMILEKLLRVTISSWVLRNAEIVLFTTCDYANVSSALKLLHGREHRIGALPNGIDVRQFYPGQSNEFITHIYKLNNEEKIVLLVARLDQAHYFKGVPIFIKAIAQLPEPIKAIIVGDGDLKHYYEKISHSFNLQNRIYFPGSVPTEDLPDYYRMADVTVLPSITMSEAFGLVLLESLACGTPVIASDLPGVRTLVEENTDGYLVKPGDVDDLQGKLLNMLSLTDQQRKNMGIAGRKKVEKKFTLEQISKSLEEVYKQVLY
jgi:glycosyltransferase involved in cell wall biosynthesis